MAARRDRANLVAELELDQEHDAGELDRGGDRADLVAELGRDPSL